MTEAVGKIVLGLILLVLLGLLMAWPTMTLWNWALVPALPVVKPIGWLQAWGLNALGGILFKSSNTSSK